MSKSTVNVITNRDSASPAHGHSALTAGINSCKTDRIVKDHEDRYDQIRIDGSPGADGSVTTKRLFENACRGRRLVGGAPTISLQFYRGYSVPSISLSQPSS